MKPNRHFLRFSAAFALMFMAALCCHAGSDAPLAPVASLAGAYTIALADAGISNAAPNTDRLPTSLTLTSKYLASVSAPSDLTNPSKWTFKVTPSTGVFTGSFNVTRTLKGKNTTLAVPFEGVLQQFPGDTSGQGFFLLPPNDDTGATAVSGSLQIWTP